MFFSMGLAKTRNSTKWKTLISNHSDAVEKSLYQNHHVIQRTRILAINKLSSKEI